MELEYLFLMLENMSNFNMRNSLISIIADICNIKKTSVLRYMKKNMSAETSYLQHMSGRFPHLSGTAYQITQALICWPNRNLKNKLKLNYSKLNELLCILKQKEIIYFFDNAYMVDEIHVSYNEIEDVRHCTICMEDIVTGDGYLLDCLHFFHDCCLEDLVRLNQTCPNCRAEVHIKRISEKFSIGQFCDNLF